MTRDLGVEGKLLRNRALIAGVSLNLTCIWQHKTVHFEAPTLRVLDDSLRETGSSYPLDIVMRSTTDPSIVETTTVNTAIIAPLSPVSRNTQHTCAAKIKTRISTHRLKTQVVTGNPTKVVKFKEDETMAKIQTKIVRGSNPKLPTPVKANRLAYYLQNYVGKDYIVDGFTQGFSLHFEGPECETNAKNSTSTIEFEEKIDEKIADELKLNRISGPYAEPPLKNFKVSPLSVRPKKEPGKIRLLHNLSYPYDLRAVNYNIPRRFAKVTYQTVGDAIEIINRLGGGCYLAKSDIESAFRLIPLMPSEYHLTGFFWKGFYIEKVLPMGSASSCYIFEKFSDCLQYILREKFNVHDTVKVIDDFLIAGKTESQCAKNLGIFMDLMKDLGVPLAPRKTFLPTTKLEFLGITLDTKSMTAHIPGEKTASYADEIQSKINSRTISLKDLQSIIGKLNHTVQVITPGKAFLRRLYDLTIGHTRPFAQIQLTNGAVEDLKLWHKFLFNHNSKPILFNTVQVVSTEINLGSDASHKGYSATFGSHWIQGSWPKEWLQYSIAFLEIYPIFLILSLFAPKMCNSQINFICDNMSVVNILNKQTSRCPLIMAVLRPMILVMLENNISFRATHIPTHLNVINDKISRQQVDGQLLQEWGMLRKADQVPKELLPENFVGLPQN